MNINDITAHYQTILPRLRCPLCSGEFSLQGNALLCSKGHCFNFNKKGFINLIPSHPQNGDRYTSALFEARQRVFQDGFYRAVAENIAALLCSSFGDEPFFLADAGCGEGYYSRYLAECFANAGLLGIDISKDAIMQAAKSSSLPYWMIGDLKHLPFAGGSMDAVLDILTPADYSEFTRILKPGGFLIKGIPGDGYLQEIRSRLKPYLQNGGDYDSHRVRAHLEEHMLILEETHILRQFLLSSEQGRAFLRMTPLTGSVAEEVLAGIQLTNITIDMKLFKCVPKASVNTAKDYHCNENNSL